jgi:hypothetical protein
MKPDTLTLATTPEGRAVLGDWYEEQGRLDVARLYRDEVPQRAVRLRKRVRKLTDEEHARLDEYARRWIAVGRCTEPADRDKAEAALLACYRYAGLAAPKRLVWAPSPLVTCLAGPQAALQLRGSGAAGDAVDGTVQRAMRSAVDDAMHRVVEDAVRDVVSDAVHDAVRDEAHRTARVAVDDMVSNTMSDAVHDAVRHEVNGPVRAAVHDAVSNTMSAGVRNLWWRYLGAQLWIGLLRWGPASVHYALDVLRLDLGREMELRARAYAALCESCCLVWPHRDFAILCERPHAVELEGPGETVEEMLQQRLVRVAWSGWEVTP